MTPIHRSFVDSVGQGCPVGRAGQVGDLTLTGMSLFVCLSGPRPDGARRLGRQKTYLNACILQPDHTDNMLSFPLCQAPKALRLVSDNSLPTAVMVGL